MTFQGLDCIAILILSRARNHFFSSAHPPRHAPLPDLARRPDDDSGNSANLAD